MIEYSTKAQASGLAATDDGKPVANDLYAALRIDHALAVLPADHAAAPLLRAAATVLRGEPLHQTQGDVLVAYADKNHARHIAQAREAYANDECEIDDNPMVSEGDDGVWVSAWVWVSNAELEE